MRGSSPLAALLGVLLACLACFALGERTIYDFTVKASTWVESPVCSNLLLLLFGNALWVSCS
jgi:hypothetical protein